MGEGSSPTVREGSTIAKRALLDSRATAFITLKNEMSTSVYCSVY